jgi:hypothetical protein
MVRVSIAISEKKGQKNLEADYQDSDVVHVKESKKIQLG